MPPSSRKSTSPAPSARRAAGATKVPAAKSPAKSGRPSKSPVRREVDDDEVLTGKGESPAAASSSASKGNVKPVAAAGAPPSKIAATPPASKAAAPASEAAASGEMRTVVSMAAGVVLLLALLAGAAFLPIPGAQRPVVTLGPNAFDGRKLKPGGGTYDGNALVVFTTKDSMDCKPCAEMKALLKSADFKQQHASWWSSNTLRVGRVYCDKNKPLCTRFGVVDDGDEDTTAPGLPHVLWFKGGEEQEAGYTGERSLTGLRDWVEEQSTLS